MIVKTMAFALLWLLLNTFFGIRLGLLFPEGNLSVWHFVYYGASVASFIWIFRHLKAKWKEVPKFGPNGEFQDYD